MFYTLTNLQGSQTINRYYNLVYSVLHSYKLTRFSNYLFHILFVSSVLHSYKLTRFSNASSVSTDKLSVLHSYKLTRFSNFMVAYERPSRFYTLTNLQGSQTPCTIPVQLLLFYTLTNLQGSQT